MKSVALIAGLGCCILIVAMSGCSARQHAAAARTTESSGDNTRLVGTRSTSLEHNEPSVTPEKGAYEPSWESLDSRPCPAWFDEAKFGIFIHWGVYSVPAWGPKGKYSEWYWHDMQNKNGPTWKFHGQTYGENFRYQDFAPMFKAEMFDPDQWADIFARSGARYVVLTSKHHDGFCLWPSAESWNWNSVDVGPHRDLLGDLTDAVRKRGIKMGFYYSLYEWYHPLYRTVPERYVDEHMLPQFKDVVERYKPSLIFADGEWDHPSEFWKSEQFLAWLFNESACREDVVINDRWGKETRSRHGGYYTTEYGHVGGGKELAERHKWEECRGMGASFGYNRYEDIFDYKSATDLIHLLVDLISKGGNLLLDIGPTADGRIPVIMQERLVEIGEWLQVNGEAIYGTRPWQQASDGDLVRYTAKGHAVYAICLGWPGRELVLTVPKPTTGTVVTMLGRDEPLRWRLVSGNMHIEVPPLSVDEVPCRHAYVFRLTGIGIESAAATETAGRPVRVVSISFSGKSIEEIIEVVHREGSRGADIIALPETCRGNDPETLDGPTITAIAALAMKHRTYIVCPIYRKEGDRRLNSAILLDRDGEVVGIYDKVYPFWSEFDLKPPASVGLDAPVYETDFGRVGMAICFDANFPEVWKRLADQGAELVIWPSAYSAGTTLQAHALANHFYIVTSTLARDCIVYDITGEEILYDKSEDINISRVTLDLDRGIYHEDFNMPKLKKLLDERGDDVMVEKRMKREAWFVLKAKRPGVSARELARQYGLEELRDYLDRSRREIDELRGWGFAEKTARQTR